MSSVCMRHCSPCFSKSYVLYLLFEPGFLWKTKLLNWSADGVAMTGNSVLTLSVLCQRTSERLLVGCGVERVSPDVPCQCGGGLGAPLPLDVITKQHSNQAPLLTGKSLLV